MKLGQTALAFTFRSSYSRGIELKRLRLAPAAGLESSDAEGDGDAFWGRVQAEGVEPRPRQATSGSTSLHEVGGTEGPPWVCSLAADWGARDCHLGDGGGLVVEARKGSYSSYSPDEGQQIQVAILHGQRAWVVAHTLVVVVEYVLCSCILLAD